MNLPRQEIHLHRQTITIFADHLIISEEGKAPLKLVLHCESHALNDNQELLAISANGSLSLIDLLRGKIRWQRNFPGLYNKPQTTAPVFAMGNLYVGVGKPSAKLYAFDIESGEELWAQVLATGLPSDPILFADRIVIIGNQKIAHAYNIRNGEMVFTHQVTGKVDGLKGKEAGEYLLLTDSDGNLRQLDRNGGLVWQWNFFEQHPELADLRKKGMSGQLGKGFDEKCHYEEIHLHERIHTALRFNGERYENVISRQIR